MCKLIVYQVAKKSPITSTFAQLCHISQTFFEKVGDNLKGSKGQGRQIPPA